MAENGRPSKRGHCLASTPVAALLTLLALCRHWREVWKETER
jgi:hypothetical protein